jgi:anti-sigma regulatory factor (Ser/Thr protein kinase)
MTALPSSLAPDAKRFRHGTFFYREDEAFLAGLLPFDRAGLEVDQAVVVAEPRPRLELLRDALGDDAGDVEFLDMAEVGVNPARIIPIWRAAVDRHLGGGRGLRGVGEPAFVGRRPAEFEECRLHELLLNDAFDDGPAWDLLCPYDEAALPERVCAAARASHPFDFRTEGAQSTAAVDPGAVRQAFGAAMAVPGAALRGEFGPADIPAVRRTVVHFATSCGLSPARVDDLALAATELASNSIRHGGGGGTVALWTEPGAAVLQFADAGRLTDPLIGRHRPALDEIGGRGLYLVHQLCDLVQVRSGPDGTTVRLTSWL